MNNDNSPLTSSQDRPISRLPADTAVLFGDKTGVYKPRLERKRRRLLAKVGFLGRFLDADEKIVFITTGCSPFSAVEELTLGHLWVRVIKRALLVFTNKRILHIPTTANYTYRDSLAQILYQDCRSLCVKGGALRAEYFTGKKEKFLGIPAGDRAIIKRINIEAPEPAERSRRPERNHLCPSCAHMLEAGPTTCTACGLPFKTQAEAVRYSLLLPGGGYFYTRHPILGLLDAMGETYLLGLTLFALLGIVIGGGPGVLPLFVFFGGLLAFEKLLTVYHAKGFVAECIPKPRVPMPTPPQRSPEQPAAPPAPERKQTLEQVLSVR